MKGYLKRLAAFFTSLCVLIGCSGTGLPVFAAVSADMVKVSSAADGYVYEDTTARVTVSLEGIPYSGKTIPTDVVLVIDRSGSMQGKLEGMVSAAKSFVSKVNLNTHRIGIVSYGSDAVEFPLSQDKSAINAFLNSMSISGNTAMDLAIDKAVEVLKDKRANADGSIVLMTDGEADNSALAMTAAENAKAKGYYFFTVALCSSETSIANRNLKKMATSETDHYSVFETSKLSQVYNSIAEKIGNCCAKNVVITQTIGSNFKFVSGSADDNIPIPTVNGNTLTWKIPQLSKGISTVSYEVAPKAGLAMGSYEHGTGTVTYEDYDGDTQTVTIDPQMIELKLHPPVITEVSPKLYDGKTEKTITVLGKYFTTDAKLYLDNVLTPVISQTTSSITFKAPVHDDGKITLKVVNTDGQSDTDILNVGPNPIISAVTPDNILEGEKVTVKITGENFVGSRASMKVMFNGEKMTLTSTGSKTVYVTGTQKLAAGVYSITIYNSNGGIVTMPNAFTVNSDPSKILSVTSVTYSECVEGNSVSVKIEGTGFTGSRSGNSVYINGVKCTITSASKTCLYAKSPSTLPVGKYDVKVENDDGRFVIKPEAFEVVAKKVPAVPAPVIKEVTPAECVQGDSVKVCIKGENFTGSRSSNTVMFGDVKATLTSASKTAIYATVPASVTSTAGSYTITVINSDGQSATADVQFEVKAKQVPQPAITEITPAECTIGDNVKICIKGENFTGSRSSNTVLIGGVKATLTSASTTALYATVPASITSNAGSYDVEVINSDGASVKLNGGFTVNKKEVPQIKITSVTPATCKKGESVVIKIQGENFTGSRSSNTVMIGDVKATLTSASKTCLYAKTPKTLDVGNYTITVYNSDGSSKTADVEFIVTG